MSESIKHIDIGRDFAPDLGVRYKRDGNNSGELFREKLLEPAYLGNDRVIISLDSITGYTASFMEEAFGGLVHRYGLAAVDRKLQFVAVNRKYLLPLLRRWMTDAEERRVAGLPRR